MYSKRLYGLLEIEKSTRKNKKYEAILKHKKTGKLVSLHFGDSRYATYQDKTGLNLYQVHGDQKRRKSYRARHKGFLKKGYWTSGGLSYSILW